MALYPINSISLEKKVKEDEEKKEENSVGFQR